MKYGDIDEYWKSNKSSCPSRALIFIATFDGFGRSEEEGSAAEEVAMGDVLLDEPSDFLRWIAAILSPVKVMQVLG